MKKIARYDKEITDQMMFQMSKIMNMLVLLDCD